MRNNPPDDFVSMWHPDIESIGGPVSRKAWEEIHRHKGWLIFDWKDAATYETLVAEIAEMNPWLRDALDAVAEQAKIERLIAKVREMEANGELPN